MSAAEDFEMTNATDPTEAPASTVTTDDDGTRNRRDLAQLDADLIASIAGDRMFLWPDTAMAQGWSKDRQKTALAVLRVREMIAAKARAASEQDDAAENAANEGPGERPRLSGSSAPTANPEDEADRIRLTELGNSIRLVNKYGHKLRFCKALGGWFVWDGKRWRLDSSGAVNRCAKIIVKQLWVEAARTTDEGMRGALLAHARRSEKAAAITAMVKLAETGDGIAVESDAFDADPWLFNCKSGILDLRTGKLRPHNPASLCKKLAPVAFDPKAEAPLFERFIAEILPDAEVRTFLQRFFGYCLTGVVRERVLALLIGNGRNGKSVLIKLITKLMGDYATYAAPQLLMAKEHGDRHPTELAALFGVRFAATSEIKEGQAFDVETMKRLTGAEPVTARYMNRDFFTFEGTWKLALASNHRPKVKDRTESSWDRLREIPFTVRIDDAKEDKKLFEKLTSELPGILNWCLAGCATWRADGLGTAGAIRRATEEYREGQNPVAAFFAERVDFSEPRARVTRKELYDAYEAWARAEGERFPLSTKTFAEAVREKGAEDVKSNGIRHWTGACLKSDDANRSAEGRE